MQCYKSLSNSYNHSLGVLVLLNSCIARHTKWFQETEMQIQKQIQIQVGQSASKEEEQKRQRLNMTEIRGSKGSRTETQEGPQVRGRPKEFCSNTETWSSDNLKPELPKIYPKACQSTPTAWNSPWQYNQHCCYPDCHCLQWQHHCPEPISISLYCFAQDTLHCLVFVFVCICICHSARHSALACICIFHSARQGAIECL